MWLCVFVYVCAVPVLSEGGHRGLVVECQDAPSTKGTIRDRLLLLWYLAYTVSHWVSSHTCSHTHEICIHTCLHMQWWIENHVLNNGYMVTMLIERNHQIQWYHQNDTHHHTFSYIEFLPSHLHGGWLQWHLHTPHLHSYIESAWEKVDF